MERTTFILSASSCFQAVIFTCIHLKESYQEALFSEAIAYKDVLGKDVFALHLNWSAI